MAAPAVAVAPAAGPPPVPLAVSAARAALFAKILTTLKSDAATPEGQARIRSFATIRGNTQESERRRMRYIVSVLDRLGLSYEHAGSQLPKDLRNVGGIGLPIEVKSANGTTACCNDTVPQPGTFYVFFHTTNPASRSPTRLPQVVACEGSEMIAPDDVEWIADLAAAIARLRAAYGKGAARRRRLTAFPRCNYSYKFGHMLASLPTVADLRAELLAHGQPTDGTKMVLQQRLRATKEAAAPAPAAVAVAAAAPAAVAAPAPAADD